MTTQPIVFLLDFDRTLINSPKLRIDLWNFFERFGISHIVAKTTYEQLVAEDTHYSMEKHLNFIASTFKKALPIQNIIYGAEREFTDMHSYLFPDVLPWLEQARAKQYLLYLVTRGDEIWQGFKLRSSGIQNYFEHIFYLLPHGEKTKIVFPKLPEHRRALLVDDNLFELDQSRIHVPDVETIYIRRFDDQDMLSSSSPHMTITSLLDLQIS